MISYLKNFLLQIKYPLLTPKSKDLNKKQYTFIVNRNLKKKQIKFIFEKIFTINICKINTCILPIKKKMSKQIIGKKIQYKKVYIKIKH